MPTQAGRFKAIRIALPTYWFWCQRVGEWESQLLPATDREGCLFSWIPLDTINIVLNSEVYLIWMQAGPRLWAYKLLEWWDKKLSREKRGKRDAIGFVMTLSMTVLVFYHILLLFLSRWSSLWCYFYAIFRSGNIVELLYLTLSTHSSFICTHSMELSSFEMKGFSSTKLVLPVAQMVCRQKACLSRVLVIKRP